MVRITPTKIYNKSCCYLIIQPPMRLLFHTTNSYLYCGRPNCAAFYRSLAFTKPRASLAYYIFRMMRGASRVNIGIWLHQSLARPCVDMEKHVKMKQNCKLLNFCKLISEFSRKLFCGILIFQIYYLTNFSVS